MAKLQTSHPFNSKPNFGTVKNPIVEFNEVLLDKQMIGVDEEDKDNVRKTLMLMLGTLEPQTSSLKSLDIEIKENYYNIAVLYPPTAIFTDYDLTTIKNLTEQTLATESVWICLQEGKLRINAKIWKNSSRHITRDVIKTLIIRQISITQSRKRPRLLAEQENENENE